MDASIEALFQFTRSRVTDQDIVEFSPGDPGYPGPNETFAVLGISFDGESRAYALSDLVGHEVADDQFDTTFVAAAY